ncbi:ion transporter [[Mycoplasma] gypis]|uniref:Ion transporter n=1 Tax=[Mycoplasma] gypis TaxID=92404 RepID=A0ABZ2RR08_9BACT|nr:ion transporter [[Mycoplasma] gypis]MBN0919319.1 ion transporter [[Mycoplasma] gypis]
MIKKIKRYWKQEIEYKPNNSLEKLSFIVWSVRQVPSKFSKERKRLRILQFCYATIISFACLISAFSLINPSSSFAKTYETIEEISQIFTFFVFIIDYVLHYITFKYRENNHKNSRFKNVFGFPTSFLGLIILICIFGSVHVIRYFGATEQSLNGFKFFKSLNVARFVRFFFILSIFAPFGIIIEVFKKQKQVLIAVFLMIIILILIFSLVIWNNETNYLTEIQHNWIKEHPDIADYEKNADYLALSKGYVKSFFDAFYFMTITLTTIGYGDIVPHAPETKAIVIAIALMGIAIIAIPSGIVAGAFLTDMQRHFNNKKGVKND